MPKRFCVKCGREDVELLSNFLCVECYIDTKGEELIKFPKIMSQKICKVCGAVYKSGRWFNYPLGNDLSKIIEDGLYESVEADQLVKEFSLSVNKIWLNSQGNYIAEVLVEGKIANKKFEYRKNIVLDLKSTLCDKCLKRKTKYYEAIIQLRGKNRVGIDTEIRKTFESVLDVEELSNISDIVEGKEGIDYYFMNKSVARRVVSKLISRYKVEVKESFYNVKIKDGRRDAKLIISVRM